MRIHCDGCGRALDSKDAIVRTWDGERYSFCGDACARAGRHLANEPYRDDESVGTGPLAEGDLDEPASPRRRPAK